MVSKRLFSCLNLLTLSAPIIVPSRLISFLACCRELTGLNIVSDLEIDLIIEELCMEMLPTPQLKLETNPRLCYKSVPNITFMHKCAVPTLGRRF